MGLTLNVLGEGVGQLSHATQNFVKMAYASSNIHDILILGEM